MQTKFDYIGTQVIQFATSISSINCKLMLILFLGADVLLFINTQLTSLKKGSSESVTDYLIRSETAASSLKTIGEQVSDGLLISMILKGLPDDYKPFVVVVTQSDREHNFQEFKLALRNFEETEHTRTNNENSL